MAPARDGFDLHVGTGGIYSLGAIVVADDGDGIAQIGGQAGYNQVNVNVNTSTPIVVNTSSITLDVPDLLGTGGHVLAISSEVIPISISTDATNGFDGLEQYAFTVPDGFDFTATHVNCKSLPAGATVLFNLTYRSSTTSSGGTDMFSETDSTATYGGTNNVTGIASFGNATVSGGNDVFVTGPASGSGAGGPNQLIIRIIGYLTRQ